MTRLEVAYHEAGHAVASHVLHGHSALVTIVPTDSYHGMCETLSAWDCVDGTDLAQTRRDLHSLVVVALAGPIAGACASGLRVDRNQDDYEGAAFAIAEYHLRISVAGAERKAKRLVSRYWADIARLAQALIERKTLQADEIRQIVGNAAP